MLTIRNFISLYGNEYLVALDDKNFGLFIRYQPNVELEELRNTPEDHPDLTCQLREWLACSEQVSLKTITSYMAGWEVIQTICQFIDGTPVGSNGDWKEFASVLGFDILFIQVTHSDR